MRGTVIYIVIALAILTVAAWLFRPVPARDGKAHLVWVVGNDPTKEVQAEMFNRTHADCRVEIDPNNGGVTKTMVQSAAGMGGDLIDGVNEYNIQTYQSAGILLDLTSLAAAGGFSPETLIPSVRPLCMVQVLNDDGSVSERQYTYPATIDNDFIIYNKALFDRLKVPYPSDDLTWDEYLDLVRRLTVYAKPGDSIPEIFGAAGAKFLVILWEKGGDLFNRNGTRSALDSPAAIAAFRFYHDLFFKYKAEPTAAIRSGVQGASDGVVGSDSGQAWFGSGKVAMVWGARWYLKNLRTYAAQQKQLKANWEKEHPDRPWPGVELRYGACQLPRFKDSPSYNVTFTGRTVGINAMSTKRDAALKFLRFLAGPEYNKYICEISGAKPPNKNYWKAEYFYHPDYPEEKPIHDQSIKAAKTGRCMQRSMFIETAVATRIMQRVLDVIAMKPGLTPDEIAAMARQAAAETNAIIDRNVSRDPKLKKAYERLTAR